MNSYVQMYMSVTSSVYVWTENLQNCFVSDKDLRGRDVLHVNYCAAMCSLKNQLPPPPLHTAARRNCSCFYLLTLVDLNKHLRMLIAVVAILAAVVC